MYEVCDGLLNLRWCPCEDLSLRIFLLLGDPSKCGTVAGCHGRILLDVVRMCCRSVHPSVTPWDFWPQVVATRACREQRHRVQLVDVKRFVEWDDERLSCLHPGSRLDHGQPRPTDWSAWSSICWNRRRRAWPVCWSHLPHECECIGCPPVRSVAWMTMVQEDVHYAAVRDASPQNPWGPWTLHCGWSRMHVWNWTSWAWPCQ